MFRGRRDRRIDRALSNVLDVIATEHAERLRSCETFREVDLLAIAMDKKRLDAFVRADILRAQWYARVEAMEE